MDPVTLGISAVGMGIKLFGALSGASASSEFSQQYNKLEQQKYQAESQIQVQRQNAMELSARRQQLEIFRNTQRARAMGLNAAVSQGAQFGSGLQGGQASTMAQGMFNSLGVNQNLSIGRNIFGLNQQISGYNSQESTLKANYQSEQSTNQGISSIGDALMGSSGTLGNIGGAVGNAFTNWAIPASKVGI